MQREAPYSREQSMEPDTAGPDLDEADNPTGESDTETMARLAALSPLEYDRCRKDEAKRLGAQLSTLDKIRQAYVSAFSR